MSSRKDPAGQEDAPRVSEEVDGGGSHILADLPQSWEEGSTFLEVLVGTAAAAADAVSGDAGPYTCAEATPRLPWQSPPTTASPNARCF